MPLNNSFDSKTTLSGRLIRSLIAAVVATLLFVFIAFINGWFVSSDAGSESLVFWTGLCAAILALDVRRHHRDVRVLVEAPSTRVDAHG